MQKSIKKAEDIPEALKSLLLDDFSVYGNDASLFAKTQAEISANTHSVVTPMCYIDVISVLPDDEQPKNGALSVYHLKPGGVSKIFWNINVGAGNLPIPPKEGNPNPKQLSDSEKGTLYINNVRKLVAGRIAEALFSKTVNGQKYDNTDVVNELRGDRLLFQIDDRVYIVSPFALPTLGQRIELKGRAMLEPSLERDMFIAKRFDSSKNIQFITKQANGIMKIFMAASENYRPLSMTTIERIYHTFGSEEGLGQMSCEGWEIDHSISRIRFVFEDFEKIQDLAFLYGMSSEETPVPGVEIISSDIGDCAFTIRGFWRVKRGYLYADEVARKHSGEIDEDKIVDEVRHTIFEKYTVLPDRFMELLDTDLTPTSVTEAATALAEAQKAAQEAKAAGEQEEAKAMENLAKVERMANRQFKDHTRLLNEMIKRVMKEITTTSLQYKKDWTERVTETLNPAAPYTAYDLMSIILDTQIMTKSDETAEKMRKSMIRLPYLDYAKFRDAIITKFALFGTRNAADDDATATVEPVTDDADKDAADVTAEEAADNTADNADGDVAADAA